MFFASALTFLQALPWLLLLINNVSPVAFAAESIGYRYFHTCRLLHGDKSGVWLPQGQTLGVLYLGAQRLLDWFDATALRNRVDLFCYGTLVNTIAFGAVVWSFPRAPPAGWRPRLVFAAV